MSIARECIETILAAYDKAADSMNRLSAEQSRNDLVTQDLLHYIEFDSIDSIVAFATVRKLKDVRQERRLVKNELEPLQKLLTKIDRSQLQDIYISIKKLEEQQKHRTYTPRVIRGGLDKAVNE